MASSMISSAPVATISRATLAQDSMVTPFTGLKSGSAFPVTHKSVDITSVTSNGGKVRCMQVWPTTGKKKFEALSYLPNLTQDQLAKQIAYLLRKGWIACIEFQLQNGLVYREHHRPPGYYDGRYLKLWKLPMFRCTDIQVIKELDNVRQVQCIGFIASKPPGF